MACIGNQVGLSYYLLKEILSKVYPQDSLKIDIYPIKIESPVSIAFKVENLVVDQDYTLYVDTTIINLIPRETPE